MGSVYECEPYLVSLRVNFVPQNQSPFDICSVERRLVRGNEGEWTVEIGGELMNRPFQCGAITIGWSGDEGPYHLLLTPIEIRQHSYNVSHCQAGESWSEKCEGR